jgi:hypothetical protein
MKKIIFYVFLFILEFILCFLNYSKGRYEWAVLFGVYACIFHAYIVYLIEKK